MADQNWAVDELLKSEEEAAAIVKDAQRDQEKKVKQAKMAAEQELMHLKKEKAKRFEEEVAQKFSTKDEYHGMEEKAYKEIELIYKSFEAEKDRVLDLLIDSIFKVDIVIPQVLKGNYEELL